MASQAVLNFAHFHRRRILVSTAFLGTYSATCYSARNWQSDLLRMGVAGSLAFTTVECLFHVVDTVNIRAKASSQDISTMGMINKIWAKEGPIGFGKGFSACFYGATFSGFLYFCLYKKLKTLYRDQVGDTVDIGLVFAAAGLSAEALTIGFKYPFDLIKCRLQSVNYIFKYQNLPHAFKKEIRKNGVGALYDGVGPFLLTYCTFIALQFSIYERVLKFNRDRMSKD